MNYTRALETFELNPTDTLSKEQFQLLYKQLAKKHHPDRSGETKKFVKLREAYDYLLQYGTFNKEKKPKSQSKKLVTTDTNSLVFLEKDEIIRRYRVDRSLLEDQIQLYFRSLIEQDEVVGNIKSVVERLVHDYEEEKTKLQLALDAKIQQLEYEYRPSFLKRMFFFLPGMNQTEFWRKYHESIDMYSRKYDALNLSFFRIIISTYGDGLNKITKSLEHTR
jgi:hypothetical protein